MDERHSYERGKAHALKRRAATFGIIFYSSFVIRINEDVHQISIATTTTNTLFWDDTKSISKDKNVAFFELQVLILLLNRFCNNLKNTRLI